MSRTNDLTPQQLWHAATLVKSKKLWISHWSALLLWSPSGRFRSPSTNPTATPPGEPHRSALDAADDPRSRHVRSWCRHKTSNVTSHFNRGCLHLLTSVETMLKMLSYSLNNSTSAHLNIYLDCEVFGLLWQGALKLWAIRENCFILHLAHVVR